MTRRATVLALVLALTGALLTAPGQAAARARWAGTWATAPVAGPEGGPDLRPGNSVRNVVHVSVGGARVRVRLSNRFGDRPLTLGHVTVAVRAIGAAAVPGTMRRVTFGGAPSAVVPAGGETLGDPVPLRVRAGSDLLVTLRLPAVSGPVTTHPWARQTSFYATGADHAADESGLPYTGLTDRWSFLTGVEVTAPRPRGTVVAFGDSITDGYTSAPDANVRWPDLLARRLRHARIGVLNAGLTGNRLLSDHPVYGVSALDRLDADALSLPGVRTLIVFEGINDIQMVPHVTDPGKITAALREIAARARARGVTVVGGTLTPWKGWRTYSPEQERVRQAVNRFVRTSPVFDAVADFDAAVRDPADPRRLRPDYDEGDHLHLNGAGDRALAGAVDTAVL